MRVSQAARPTASTELEAENLKLYLLAFFPAFLSAVVADMALGRRLGPSPPRAPMTGLLYNLAPSRHFLLLLRSGVSGADERTKQMPGARHVVERRVRHEMDQKQASEILIFFIEHISRAPAIQPKIKIFDA